MSADEICRKVLGVLQINTLGETELVHHQSTRTIVSCVFLMPLLALSEEGAGHIPLSIY